MLAGVRFAGQRVLDGGDDVTDIEALEGPLAALPGEVSVVVNLIGGRDVDMVT
jgi:hypothetical protein